MCTFTRDFCTNVLGQAVHLPTIPAGNGIPSGAGGGKADPVVREEGHGH